MDDLKTRDGKPDLTQEVLNHMARVQIEATIKGRVAGNFLLMQAERMNKSKTTISEHNRRALLNGMSETAHDAAVRQPVVYNRPAASVH